MAAAGIGATATYFAAPADGERIVITGDAAKAAKNGKLTIEIVRREETDGRTSPWILAMLPGMMLGMAALMWAGSRSNFK